MKKSFRGYNCEETDAFIESLKQDYEQKLQALQSTLAERNAELEKAHAEAAELAAKQNGVAAVLIDAVERAQTIEKDYQMRAQQSDKYYTEVAQQWMAKLKACQEGVAALQSAAETEYAKMHLSIEQFAAWTNALLTQPEQDKAFIEQPETEPVVNNAINNNQVVAGEPITAETKTNETVVDETATAKKTKRAAKTQPVSNAAPQPEQTEQVDDKPFDSDEFQKQVLKGANADLEAACNDLGIKKKKKK